jgi:glycosyltransferase involved in cell wall biosynthesis
VRVAMIGYTVYELDARVSRAADALVESGHHVDLFVTDHAGLRASNSELLTIHRLRMKKRRSAAARYAYEYGFFCTWAFVRVSMLQARNRYDVVYVHNMPNFLVFAGCLPKLRGAKIVLDVHDPAPELLASIRGRDLQRWLRSLAVAEERVSIAFSDALITVNESMRRRISAMSGRPVTVVMNLPDPAVFGAWEESRRREATDFLVYSGAIAYRNGIDLVIEALCLLGDEFPALRLRVIGDGPARESLVRMAEDLGVAHRVDFLDCVPNHDIPALVSGAAAGVSAQRDDIFGSLVFSMKVAEYASLGLPVVCSAITTMRHYFDDDEVIFFEPGSVCDLARAVRELLANPAAAEERAARGRAKLRKLDWPAQKETLVATVEALACDRRLRARGESAVARTR